MMAISKAKRLLAAALLSAAGASFFMVVPLLVGAAIERYGLSIQEAGEVPGSFFAGYCLSAAAAIWWVHHWPWRIMAALGFVLMAGGLAAAAWSSAFAPLLACYAMAGVGGGILFTLPMCIISNTGEHHVGFGYKIVAEQLVGILLLLLLSILIISRWGFSGANIALAILLLVLMPALRWVPVRAGDTIHRADRGAAESPPSISSYLAIANLVVYFSAFSGAYAFIEQVGRSAGIESASVGRYLAMGTVAGGIGAYIMPHVVKRWSEARTIFFASIFILSAFYFLYYEQSSFRYGLALILMLGCWNFVLALHLSISVRIAPGARFAAAMAPALAAGAMLGPVVFGALAEFLGIKLVLICACLCILLSNAGFVMLCTRTQTQFTPDIQPVSR